MAPIRKFASAEKDTPLAVAAGVGWNGNFSTNAPDSFLASVKYLVEDSPVSTSMPQMPPDTPQ